jgi:preprotein translocase subunit SecY
MSRQVLLRPIAVTLGVLLVYWVGTYVPVHGIGPAAWEQAFRWQGPLWSTHFWMY